MNVIVQSKSMVVTQALRDFAQRQARKLSRRGQHIAQVTVFLEHVKNKKNDMQSATVKFLVTLPHKTILVQERAQDLYVAMVDAAEATARQVSRVKERRLAKAVRSARYD